ncbi:MAG TPA: hypothetical protein VF426_01845, partial [Marmoricola sp.]
GTILGHQDVLATTIAQVLQAQGCEQERTLVGPVIVLESGPDAVNEMLRVGYSAALRRSGIADIRHLLSYYPEPTQCPSAFLAAAPWREVPLGAQLAGWLIDWGPAGAIGFALNTVLAEQGFPDRLGDESLLARGAEGRLADALPQIFGDSPEDRMLCTIIEMTHVRRDLSQAQILNTLHVSRATYFRLLRQARERVLAAG